MTPREVALLKEAIRRIEADLIDRDESVVYDTGLQHGANVVAQMLIEYIAKDLPLMETK